MSHNLNSLKEDCIRNYIGECLGVIREDTRRLDYGSYSSCRVEGVARAEGDVGFGVWVWEG